MATHNAPLQKCPCCGMESNRATNPGDCDNPPKPGDYSICFDCGAILRFNDDLISEPVVDESLEFLKTHQRETYDQISRVIVQLHNHKKRIKQWLN